MEDNNNQLVEGNIDRIVGKELKRIAEDKLLGMDYVNICALALEVLDKGLGENYDFPVNIEKVVKSFGIEIYYQPLNGEMGKKDGRPHKVVGRNLKKINRFTKEQSSIILIDDESGKDEQRYALAHELGHYLIHQEDKVFNSEYCVMPMLFKRMEEMVADIFAIFLLIPLPIFLNEFMTYIGEQSVPVKTSEWLKYLSIVSGVPYEDVAIGYQNIRYVCGIMYGEKEGLLRVDETIKREAYDEEIRCVLKEQFEKMRQAMKNEVIDKLFC